MTTISEVIKAAESRWPIVAADVLRSRYQAYAEHGEQTQRVWQPCYVLYVLLEPGGDFAMVAQRPTLSELLQLVQTRPEPWPQRHIAPRSLQQIT